MGAPRKYYPHGAVVFASLSLEQGLLLLANPLCQLIIRSCLARAKFLYPVRLCHFIIEGNHVHMIFVVIDPSDACHFVGHFKAETAHRINQLFGWKKRTIWCEGYDSPVVLSPVRALMCIAYLYANPAKDNLEDSIDKFPGLSSWKMFRKGDLKKDWAYIPRPRYRELSAQAHSLEGYTRVAARLLANADSSHEFELEPDAWLDAFGISEKEEQEKWNQALVKRVRVLEKRARTKREEAGKSPLGRAALLRQKMSFAYKSNRNGKRMWCLSEKKRVRVQFISFLKKLREKAREVYRRWHLGDYSLAYPPGLFPPSQPKLFEPIAVWG
jgi:hypothetical protein